MRNSTQFFRVHQFELQPPPSLSVYSCLISRHFPSLLRFLLPPLFSYSSTCLFSDYASFFLTVSIFLRYSPPLFSRMNNPCFLVSTRQERGVAHGYVDIACCYERERRSHRADICLTLIGKCFGLIALLACRYSSRLPSPVSSVVTSLTESGARVHILHVHPVAPEFYCPVRFPVSLRFLVFRSTAENRVTFLPSFTYPE